MLHTTRYVAWLLLSFLCLSQNNIIANAEADAFGYIEMYKDIAIQERIRTGIPTSITLAQGLYESGIGGSELATEANNHFGIKCKNTWQGESYYIEDDDFDANGRLIKSCFRKYDSAEASYRDHSKFLVQNVRYKELFLLADSDYKGWAKGLKRCGYATNPKYAGKLVELIERYALYQYDQMNPVNEGRLVETPEQETPVQNISVNYNPNIQLVTNDPNAPEAYSVADYVRNSYSYAETEIETDRPIESITEKTKENNSSTYWESPPLQDTKLAQNRIVDTPVPTTNEEVLSAPMFDIEYYELTEKGISSQAKQKRQVKYISSPSSSLQIYPRKHQFKRRGK